jgi:hypothetical protein
MVSQCRDEWSAGSLSGTQEVPSRCGESTRKEAMCLEGYKCARC